MTNYTDKELIKLIQGSLEERNRGLRYIYVDSGWIPLAKRLLLKEQSQISDVKNAIQESLIAFDNHLRNFNFEQKGSLKNFFLGICKGRIYSNKRAKKRMVLTNENLSLDKVEEITPEVIMLREEQKKILRFLVQKIGEPCKSVLTLYQLSYSMREIGKKINRSESAAKKMSFTCRKKLKNLIASKPHLLIVLNLKK